MGQFVQVLFYLGAVQGLLLSIFLFSIKTNRISNRFLGVLTFFWAIILLQFPLQEQGLYTNYPHLLKTISNLLFAFFPLIFLHVKYLLSDIKRFEKKDLLHFIPLLINIILHLDYYFLSGPEKIEIIRNKILYYRVIGIIGDEVIALQGIAYSILVFKRLTKYKKEIRNYQSNIDKTILKVLLVGTSLTLLSWIIGTIGINLDFFNVRIQVDLFMYVYLILVIVIYFISYTALITPEIYKLDESKMQLSIVSKDEEKLKLIEEDIEKQKNTTLIKPELIDQNNKLVSFMELEKPFLNPEISLQDLVAQLGFSRHQLSIIINQIHQMNFYEFINTYRVEEVKRLMHDPANKNLKLMSIAYDAGFNSKASFNRVFKQMTEQTPSQYFSEQWSDL